MNNQNQNPPNRSMEYVYPPARASTVALAEFERRIARKDPLVWGLPALDNRVVPAMPGDLISILGRPGMGKTMLCLYLCRQYDEIVRQANAAQSLDEPPEVVIYATFETTVEEFVGIISGPISSYSLEDIGRGKANLATIRNSLILTLGSSLVVFGQSRENRHEKHPPGLYDLDEAIYVLQEQNGWKVKALLVDYLQRMPAEANFQAQDKVAYVSANLDGLKRLAMRHGLPVVVAVQAKRDVDHVPGTLKFPSMDDGQWTSSIEQTSDKVFGVTMPAKYAKLGDEVVVGKWLYPVLPGTLGVKLLKQRFGPVDSSDVWLYDLDPVRVALSDHVSMGEAEVEDVL